MSMPFPRDAIGCTEQQREALLFRKILTVAPAPLPKAGALILCYF